jgi:hypothetical protein
MVSWDLVEKRNKKLALFGDQNFVTKEGRKEKGREEFDSLPRLIDWLRDQLAASFSA